MAHYLLHYQLVADYLQRRGEFRDRHLRHAWQAVERGELLLGGAAGEPADIALLLFDVDDPAIIEAFARADPYVVAGLVTDWQVRRWHTVVGAHADTPVRAPD